MASVLVIDPDTLSRKELVTAITSIGHVIIDFASGYDALRHLHTQGVDLLLCGVDARDPNRRPFVFRLLKEYPLTPLVAIGKDRRDETLSMLATAVESGAVDFMIMPVSEDELKRVLKVSRGS